jgi:hypothetical protein
MSMSRIKNENKNGVNETEKGGDSMHIQLSVQDHSKLVKYAYEEIRIQ